MCANKEPHHPYWRRMEFQICKIPKDAKNAFCLSWKRISTKGGVILMTCFRNLGTFHHWAAQIGMLKRNESPWITWYGFWGLAFWRKTYVVLSQSECEDLTALILEINRNYMKWHEIWNDCSFSSVLRVWYTWFHCGHYKTMWLLLSTTKCIHRQTAFTSKYFQLERTWMSLANVDDSTYSNHVLCLFMKQSLKNQLDTQADSGRLRQTEAHVFMWFGAISCPHWHLRTCMTWICLERSERE